MLACYEKEQLVRDVASEGEGVSRDDSTKIREGQVYSDSNLAKRALSI